MRSIFLLIFIIVRIKSEDLTIKQIHSFGYDGEKYEVETEDGYYLTIHRFKPLKKSSKVCFLMHGLLLSSTEFLFTQRTSLGLYLFENGCDVFLGNVRGSKYSMKHKKFHPDSSDFWNFSIHEFGYFDLPAMIDFVLNLTGSKSLYYIGHSQGATIPLILLSTRSEYNQKIKQLHLSAPAVFMGNFPNPVIKKFGRQFIKQFSKRNFIDLKNIFKALQESLNKNCIPSRPFYFIICIFIEFLLLGDNFTKLEADSEVFSNFLPLLSSSLSSNQLLHFFQLIETGKFRQFDLGKKENIEKYGAEKPPDYDLKKVIVPTFIYCAERDGVVAKKDVEHLRDTLPNVINFKLLKNYNHIDFDISINARKDVHTVILRAINEEKQKPSKFSRFYFESL